MKVTIRCPHCQKSLGLEEESLGKKVRCAGCRTVFEAVRAKDGEAPAPGQGEAVSPAALPPARRRPAAEDEPVRRREENDEEDDAPARRKPDRRRAYHDEDDEPRRRRQPASSSAGLVLGIVAGGVLLLLLICGGAVAWFVVAVRSAADEMRQEMADAAKAEAEARAEVQPPQNEPGPAPPGRPAPDRGGPALAPGADRGDRRPFEPPPVRQPPPVKQPPAAVPPPPAVPPPEPVVPKQNMELALKIDLFNTVAISTDSKAALVAAPGGKLVHYSCPDFAARGTYELPGDAYEAVLDRNGNLYAMCTAVKKDAMFPRDRRGVGDLYVFPMADVLANRRGEAKRKPSAQIALRGLAATMILSPDGQWVYLLDTHNQKIVRVSTARQKVDGELDKLEPSTQAMCLTPDGKSLYALAVNGALQKFDAAAWKLEKIFQVRGGHSDLQATDDGRVFLNSSEGQWTNVRLFDVTKEGPPRPWAGIYHSNCIRLSPDQRRLYVSCWHLSPSNITSYYVPPEKSAAQGKQCGACGLDANFGARGNVVVSPDGSFLFCDAGKIILLGR